MNITKYEVAAPAQVNIERMAAQAELASDIEAFLARGGKITVIPLPVPVPRNEHKNAPKKRVPVPKKTREPSTEWLNCKKYDKLKWDNNITTRDIAQKMGVAESTVRNYFQMKRDFRRSYQIKLEAAIDALISEKGAV